MFEHEPLSTKAAAPCDAGMQDLGKPSSAGPANLADDPIISTSEEVEEGEMLHI
jgi:hypothetical protein